ncbi:MAG TPA: vanadium-dependent haloperoxidase [Candidatus Dormibacteraeota bacterium]|nr:vanadium-dependent haloperoxidase [Candidatus Dormibacteraeota bacterium]
MRARVCGVALALGLLFASGGAPPVQARPDNVVVDWNQTMLAAFATANVPAPNANRLGATVQASVFDAVNGIEGRYQQIHVPAAAPDDASPQAAAASAAHSALLALFPAQQASLDAAFAASLQTISDDEDGQSIADGLAWGAAVAANIVAWRAGDGFGATPPPYVFSTAPGQWQPTPGGSGPPKFRTLATTTPWAMTSPSEFRPSGPPALTSARYAQDFNEVMAFGALNSTVRTSEQTQTAVFWQRDTPVATWDRLADSLLIQNHKNVLQSARILALTNISIADAIIAVFDAKNAYNSWRPVTAIGTTVDPTWLPLMTTPYFQEYPSAHSGTSSAAAAILASFFGDDTSFTLTSAGLPGVTRDFTSFHDAVAQVTDARVWAGFHFRFSCDDADVLGARIAANTESTLMQPAGD